MKKILHFAVIGLFFVSCSPDDDKATSVIPEKFDVKVEIKALEGTVSPKIYIAVNSSVVKTWEYQQYPFEGNYTYNVTGQEIVNSSCNCIRIRVGAYIAGISQLEEFKLYIDGKLVDFTNESAPPTSDGIMNYTILEYVFNP